MSLPPQEPPRGPPPLKVSQNSHKIKKQPPHPSAGASQSHHPAPPPLEDYLASLEQQLMSDDGLEEVPPPPVPLQRPAQPPTLIEYFMERIRFRIRWEQMQQQNPFPRPPPPPPRLYVSPTPAAAASSFWSYPPPRFNPVTERASHSLPQSFPTAARGSIPDPYLRGYYPFSFNAEGYPPTTAERRRILQTAPVDPAPAERPSILQGGEASGSLPYIPPPAVAGGSSIWNGPPRHPPPPPPPDPFA